MIDYVSRQIEKCSQVPVLEWRELVSDRVIFFVGSLRAFVFTNAKGRSPLLTFCCMLRRSLSEGETSFTLLVEPTVIPSATNLENQMPVTHDSSEPTPVRVTDEKQDRESPDMEN